MTDPTVSRTRVDIFVGAGVLTAVCLVAAVNASSFLLVGLVSVAIGLYPAYRLLSGRERDVFAPIHLFVIYIVFTVHLRTLIIINGNSGILQPLYDSGGEELRGLLGLGLAATAIFLVFLYVGYYGKLAERLCAPVPRLTTTPPEGPEVLAALLLAAGISIPIGALLHSLIGEAVAAGRFTAVTRVGGIFWMGYLLRFAIFGAMIPFVVALMRPRSLPVVVTAGFAISAALGVFVLWPKKIVLANQVLALMVCFHYLRHWIRPRTVIFVGMIALLSLPLLSAFRYWGFEGLSPVRLAQLSELVWDNPSFLFRDLLMRSFGAESLVLIFDDFRRTGVYEFGGTLLEATRWFIPRSLWPEKPPTYAITFGQQFLARTNFFSVNVSGTPTVIGELFLNFGFLGLTVGAWMVGVFLRIPYAYLIVKGQSIGSVLLYATFLAGAVILVEGPIEPQIMDMFVSLVFVGILLFTMEAVHRGLRIWPAPQSDPQ